MTSRRHMTREQFLARQKAYGEGAQACASRQPRTSNPYPPQSELWGQWDEGWHDQRFL